MLLPRVLPRDGQETPQHTLTLEEYGGTLIILYDNNPFKESCMTEWGFSCLVELEDKTILFDTGSDPEVFAHNIDALGVDVTEIDCRGY